MKLYKKIFIVCAFVLFIAFAVLTLLGYRVIVRNYYSLYNFTTYHALYESAKKRLESQREKTQRIDCINGFEKWVNGFPDVRSKPTGTSFEDHRMGERVYGNPYIGKIHRYDLDYVGDEKGSIAIYSELIPCK